MLALILAAVLNSPSTGPVVVEATVYLATVQAVATDKNSRAQALGQWLDSLDGERIRSAARYSPFADDDGTRIVREKW